LIVIASLWTLAAPHRAAAEPVTLPDIRQNLFAICSLPNGQHWIVGELGRIYSTADNGQSFERSVIKRRDAFLAIDCSPAGSLMVVGQHGLGLRSQDSGKTWQEIDTGTDRNLLALAYAGNDVAVAIGDFGTLIRTADGGNTWTRIPLPEEIPLPEDIAEIIEPGDVLLYDIDFVDEMHGWIAGEFGVIFTTADGGQTWTAQETPIETTLFGISFADTQRGWAVGLEEVLLRTTDGGVTWERQEVPRREGFVLALYGIEVTGGKGWAVGDNGMLLRSNDAGESWERVELPIELAANWLRDIDLAKSGDGMIVGSGGLIMVTRGDQYRKLGE
jgi:photosystem II stability/assembly factor-like uncharacterized protein